MELEGLLQLVANYGFPIVAWFYTMSTFRATMEKNNKLLQEVLNKFDNFIDNSR